MANQGVNKAILIGNLGKDPELRDAGKQKVCEFSLATNESWEDSTGTKQERTQWHTIAAWGKLGELCARYLKKGRRAYVEGRINYRTWEDKEGQKRYSTEIIAKEVQFLDSKGDRDDRRSSDSYSGPESEF